MTEDAAKWASSHDWHYKSLRCGTEEWCVIVECVVGNSTESTTKLRVFTNFREMIRWAGY